MNARTLWGFAIAIVVMSATVCTSASALDISTPGEGAGQTLDPQGVAVDTETGQIYVADAGNRRVDVFDSEGTFEMAFGWGVADGSAELQTCGPAATPPTATCRQGLAGGAAGEFTGLGDIAVDNDPSSGSHHDIYVVDGRRVQKFDPEGNFLLAWGGGVISAGAEAVGTVTTGSSQITAVQPTKNQLEPGQLLTGTGIAAGSRIVSLGDETITISQPATSSGTGVTLTAPAGAGATKVNEVQRLTTEGAIFVRLTFSTPNPGPSVETTENIEGLTAAKIQNALVALPSIDPGDVAVTGSGAGPYNIEFTGRYADTDVEELVIGGAGDLRLITVRNGHSSPMVCSGAAANSCSSGVEGFDPSLGGQLGQVTHLGVGPSGVVYVADSVREQTGFGSDRIFDNRVQTFEPDGSLVDVLPLSETEKPFEGFTVESSGDFLVSNADQNIRKYDSTGALLETRPANLPGILGIDTSDDLFSVELDQGFRVIAEFDQAGNTIRRFGYGEITGFVQGLAANSTASGDVIVSEGDRVRYLSFPGEGPIIAPQSCSASPIGNTKATLLAEVNPEGRETTVHFQYVDQQSFESEGGFSSPNAVTTPESASIGADFVLHQVTAEVDVKPETTYHCRVIATDSEDNVATGLDGTFKTLPPFEIVQTWVSQATSESVTLNASVKPFGIPAVGHFEYVDEETFQVSGFAEAKRAPVGEEIDFGNDPLKAEKGSASVSGLEPGTKYRYRIRVSDSFFPEGIPGPTKAFRTFAEGAEVPDSRGYELVSPTEKNSADVAAPGAAGGLFESNEERARIAAAAGDGEALTYTSFIAFGPDPASAPGASQYLSRRTVNGWSTENINLAGVVRNPLRPPFTGFSPDLSLGAVVIDEPSLTGEAPAGTQNLYLRNQSTGELTTITTEAPQVSGGEIFCAGFAGATPDGKHVIFGANGALAGAPKAKGFSLYEWTEGQGLALVSVLTNGNPATPGEHGFGPRGDNCSVGAKFIRGAISEDGQRVFWTLAKSGEFSLMARLARTQTIQLDAAQSGAPGPSGGGRFWAATPDGSRVLFTDGNGLVEGANTGGSVGIGDLYRYDFDNPEGERLEDLTPAAATPGSESARVLGVLGSSTDGSTVYFVANGVLAAGANPGNCALEGNAEANHCNLYLYRDGQGIRFIAQLGGIDDSDWSAQPKGQSARVSPDGRHLAFLSGESLTGYDNIRQGGEGCHSELGIERTLEGDPRCAEAFIYDVDANGGEGQLVCASCNPSGALPLGPTFIPGWSNPYEQPHHLSDDGSRLFFETLDALDPSDENDRYDTYEFEFLGSGGCDEESPSFNLESGGCTYLISSGHSDDNSYLVDASTDGADVFFTTRERLLPSRDLDERFDVYDFRVGGGFPEIVEPPPCVDEGCRPPARPQPANVAPPTSSFNGPGNVKPKKAQKHHKKKHHKKHKRHKHHKKHKREAGR